MSKLSTFTIGLSMMTFITLTLSSCISSQNNNKKSNLGAQEIMPKQEIDDFIVNCIKISRKTFNWEVASDEMLYSAIMHSNGYISLGYKPHSGNGNPPYNKYTESIELPEQWKAKKDSLIQYIVEKERKYRDMPQLTANELLHPLSLFPMEGVVELPNFYIKISDPAIVSEFRKDETITFIEPSEYPMDGVYEGLQMKSQKNN